MAALPPAADRRPVALLGVPRPRPRRPAGRGAAVGLAGALPVGRPDGPCDDRPDQGHPAARRDRDEDRALACELLASEKDRAENVMIVDVLRNDLGRVCAPGSVRVPRLCRLERTAAVQHLVSTVTGQLDADRDAFDLLAASFPGGSITGAPKIRAMEMLEELEPVRRGPYTGALGWIGPDGAMQPRRSSSGRSSRTVARLSLHVGGGITCRSDPAAEWDETVAKARGPLGAIGGQSRSPPSDGRAAARLGRRASRCPPASSTFRHSTAASSSATASSRRSGRGPVARPSSTSTSPAFVDPPTGFDPAAAGRRRAAGGRDRRGARGRGPGRRRRRCQRSASRSPVASSTAAACCRPTSTPTPTIVVQAWPVPPTPAAHLEAGLHLVASRIRRDPENPLLALKTTSRADYVYARLEARRPAPTTRCS